MKRSGCYGLMGKWEQVEAHRWTERSGDGNVGNKGVDSRKESRDRKMGTAESG